jgi:hypothetical protein
MFNISSLWLHFNQCGLLNLRPVASSTATRITEASPLLKAQEAISFATIPLSPILALSVRVVRY